MRVLHFAVDEKYIPFAQDVFEQAHPGNNRFRVVRNRGGGGGFVRESADTSFVPTSYWFSRRLRQDMAWADCLVVHFLSRRFARAVTLAPPGLAVVWHGWGKDYYGLLDGYSDRLHLPLTEDYLKSVAARPRPPSRAGLRQALGRLVDDAVFRDAIPRALARIDVISMLPAEFDLLRRSQPQVRARFHQLYYSSAESTFMTGPAAMDGPDILLGNSASPTNNHLEAFEALRRLDLGDRQLLVPLSYGEADYADHVAAVGTRIFGTRFVPLRGFLPLPEYVARISGCGFVFMNHVRQQATGNVSIALLKGAKVFLREENLLTPFYRDMGAAIHAFPEHPASTSEDVFAAPSARERERNRQVVMEYWAMATVVRQARQLAAVVGKE